MKTPEAFPVTVKRGNSVVKIYRHENGKYEEFKVAYYVDGKRKLETFAEYSRAKRRADDINDSVKDGDTEALSMSREDRILFERAKAAIKGTGVEIDTAAREYAEARKILGKIPLLDAVRDFQRRHPASLKKLTVQELYAGLLDAKRKDGLSDVYLKDLSFRLSKFSEAFHCYVSDITADQISTFLRESGASGRNRNNNRRAIGTLIRFAEKKGALPAGEIKMGDVDRVQAPPLRRECFTPEEMVKLLKAAQPNLENLKPGFNRRYATEQGLLPLLLLGGFAGMRTNAEIKRQLWSDINLQTGYITVTGAKGGTAADRLIPISENLRQWLAVCPRTADTCCTYDRPEDAIKRLAKRAGVTWKNNALRHSYGSYRAAVTQNLPQVALEMGNSVKMVVKHYREKKTKEQGNTWFAIQPDNLDKIIPMPKAA